MQRSLLWAWIAISSRHPAGRPFGFRAGRGPWVHRSWIYKLLACYRALGEAGLEPRSRRPLSSPMAMAEEIEDEIVLLRKQLAEEGLDAGAVTIH